MPYTYVEAKSLVEKYSETIIGMPLPDVNNFPLAIAQRIVIVPKDIIMPIINLYLNNDFNNEDAINEYRSSYNMNPFEEFEVYVVGVSPSEHLIIRDKIEDFIEEFL